MSTYRVGTVTVNNASTAVSGSGTGWIAAGIRAGDYLFVNGLFAEVASVASNTALTLVQGWPGANASNVAYSMALVDDGQRSLAALNAIEQALGGGTLTSLGALSAVANEMPYWTGAGVMGKTALTAAARALLGLSGATGAKLPVVTGASTAALRDIVGTVSQSGGTPTGAMIESGSNANGYYIRWADGTQLCWRESVVSSSVPAGGYSEVNWTFPAAFSGGPLVVPNARSFNGAEFRANAGRFLRGVGGFVSSSVGVIGCANIHSSAVDARVDGFGFGRWF